MGFAISKAIRKAGKFAGEHSSFQDRSSAFFQARKMKMNIRIAGKSIGEHSCFLDTQKKSPKSSICSLNFELSLYRELFFLYNQIIMFQKENNSEEH